MSNFRALLPTVSDYSTLTDKQQIKELQTIVYSLVQNLDGALSSLDERNFSPAYHRATMSVKEAALKVLEMVEPGKPLGEDTLTNRFKRLREAIVENAGQITQMFNVSLTQTANSIIGQVEENYAAKSDVADLHSRITSELEQTSFDILMKFKESHDYAIDLDGQLQALKETLQTYIRFTIEGIEIGKLGSAFTAKFDNTEVGFYQNGVKIAYFANRQLFVLQVETEKLTIKGPGSGYVEITQSGSGMVARYRRG